MLSIKLPSGNLSLYRRESSSNAGFWNNKTFKFQIVLRESGFKMANPISSYMSVGIVFVCVVCCNIGNFAVEKFIEFMSVCI